MSTVRKLRRVRSSLGGLVLVGAVVLAACGTATESTSGITEAPSSTQTTAASVTTESTVPVTEATVLPDGGEEVEEVEADPSSKTFGSGETLEAPTAEADKVVDVKVVDGEVEIEDLRVEVAVGSTVGVVIESDEVEHMHLHGYDILVDIAPGEVANFSFLADQAGVFEVELEESGRFLFEIQVS